MYDFFYEMDGLIKVGNCALAKNTCNRNHLYEVGSILYIRAKALIGVLEKVYIKQINFPKNCNISCFVYTTLYIDDLNFIHNEEDIISLEEANYLIKEYIIFRNSNLERIALDCWKMNFITKKQ